MGININNEIQFTNWIIRAGTVRIEDEIARRGVRLKRQGRELIGPCPLCGGTDRFAINVSKQIWNCRGCRKGGDTLDLVQHLDACDFLIAVRTLTGEPPPHTPRGNRHKLDSAKIARHLAQMQEQHECARAQRADEQRQLERRQAEKASWLWSQHRTITENCPAALYLRKRGYTGHLPATLGYLPPNADHPPSMIAAFGLAPEIEPGIIAVPASVTGVHLTRLTAAGDKLTEANGEKIKAKIMVGSSMGLPIVLAPATDLLAIDVVEGIEDGLSIFEARQAGLWVAGAANRMPALAAIMPDYVECVNIFAHRDDAGIRHARELARLLSIRGIEVHIKAIGD